MFGLMAMLGSSNLHGHFTLSLSTQRLQGDVDVMVLFGIGHGKGEHNGVGAMVK
jgi:hypothetical protein